MREKVPEGEFFTYDERWREIGKPMFLLACVMSAIVIHLRLINMMNY